MKKRTVNIAGKSFEEQTFFPLMKRPAQSIKSTSRIVYARFAKNVLKIITAQKGIGIFSCHKYVFDPDVNSDDVLMKAHEDTSTDQRNQCQYCQKIFTEDVNHETTCLNQKYQEHVSGE